jgi:RimJ/RimL family protein N-acetyltransferase
MSAIRDEDMPDLAQLALDGIHDRETMPFSVPWTDAPPADLPAAMAAYYWRTRAEFSPQRWHLDLVVRVDGRIVGTQGLGSHGYLTSRTAETGSWLGRAHQGKGIGTLMRQAMCALGFDHLDAVEITSGAYTDNPASLAVSRKVGYQSNGTVREERRPGELAFRETLRLVPDDFVRPADRLEVEGIDVLRRFIGLT